MQLFGCVSIMINISVIDVTFADVKSCMPMGILYVMFAATVKQPALTNSCSAQVYVCVTWLVLVGKPNSAQVWY